MKYKLRVTFRKWCKPRYLYLHFEFYRIPYKLVRDTKEEIVIDLDCLYEFDYCSDRFYFYFRKGMKKTVFERYDILNIKSIICYRGCSL